MKAVNAPSTSDLCLSCLQEGGLVLTANRRLARLIRERHDARQLASGLRVWPTAQVMPLESWLAATWQEAATAAGDAPALLTDLQAVQPWLEAVEASESGASLASPGSLAEAARRAWLALRQHHGSLDDVARHPLTPDQAAFLHWARSVEARLAREGWLDPGLVTDAVTACASQAVSGAPIVIAGFPRLRPDQRGLVDALVAAGRKVEIAPLARAIATRYSVAAGDGDLEVGAMLDWARDRLAAHPGARLALVVPDLAGSRASLERRLAAALQPSLEQPGSAAQARAYDLAGGTALLATGIVADALDVLACVRPTIEFECVSRLLRSPYLAAADPERGARLRLDLDLREVDGLAEWPAAQLAARARGAGATVFAGALEQAQASLRGVRGKRPAGDWATALGGVLSGFGWPGPGSLATDEFQAARAFREALGALASLQAVGRRLDLSSALGELRRLCQAPFKPERGFAPVVVLDRLEPPGLEFDGLWVAGLTSSAWPRSASPLPLLPVPLQRSLGMPGATPEAAQLDAETTTAAWLAGAGEVILSWPQVVDDARSEVSPLVPVSQALEPLPPVPDAARELAARRNELIACAPGSRLPLVPEQARGGARLFELQSKCPFRAFAELRLGAREFVEPEPGVGALARGSILHRALQLFWDETLDSAALQALDEGAREARVTRCVAQALAEELDGRIGPHGLALEAAWQHKAIAALLEIEAGRRPFRVIGREEKLAADFAGIPLRLRLDRVDEVDGKLLVIDYKTGGVKTSGWVGPRMDAPQLPLYSLVRPGQVAGIAFARANPRAAKFEGVSADADLLKGLKPAAGFKHDGEKLSEGWSDLQRHWWAWMERLAKDHLTGHAQVDPKQPGTCDHCHLDALCRVRGRFDEELPEEGSGDAD
ncbi:MAG: PD-(D/E)XK nuclease family protein [Gammaproteobacteria bacterium]|nr:PD-(D/E)XK nuclease family protein [Gammaproteobacteria bacterium]